MCRGCRRSVGDKWSHQTDIPCVACPVGPSALPFQGHGPPTLQTSWCTLHHNHHQNHTTVLTALAPKASKGLVCMTGFQPRDAPPRGLCRLTRSVAKLTTSLPDSTRLWRLFLLHLFNRIASIATM